MISLERPSAIDTIYPKRVSTARAIILFGFAMIGLGVFLPWVGETPLRVYVLGMGSGFERPWGKRFLLGAALGTLLVLVSVRSPRRWSVVGPIVAAIGAATVLIAVFATPLTGRWSPEIGVFVAILGGLFVAIASLASLV